MGKYNISAVLACNAKVDLLKDFYRTFRKNNANVPLVVSALQAEKGIVDFLKSLNDEYLTVVEGTPVDGHHVSFSENYNAAINAVTTDKLVLVHTDMVFGPSFFEILDSRIEKGEFMIYTTVEPPVYVGHRRPGKAIGNFGTGFEDFKKKEFEQYCFEHQRVDDRQNYGYGFFLSGYKEDFEAVGGFDMVTFNPVFCEDDDFMVRMRVKGYHAKVNDHAISYHFVSKTTRTNPGEPMAFREFRANQAFARKWGIEARFLWFTDYESSEQPLVISGRKLVFKPLDTNDVQFTSGIEPLFNYIRGNKPDNIDVNLQDKFISDADIINYDVEIQQLKPLETSDVMDLFTLAGGLRFGKKLKVGVFMSVSNKVVVHIRRSTCDIVLEDQRNYLSLQKEIKYE